MSKSKHDHDVVIYGNVNLFNKGMLVGVIDVWRCRSCDQIFCEEKRFVFTELAPEVGMPPIASGVQWAVLACQKDQALAWSLVKVKPGEEIRHNCIGKEDAAVTILDNLDIKGRDRQVKHKVFLIEGHVNKELEIGSY
ncbi:MAG: hypothetical protein ACE5KG_03285 [Nitrososphaerales archaeon]